MLRTVELPDITPERLTLYLPHPESKLCTELAQGSAIVGLPLASGRVRIYYEGNVIGAENLKRFRDRAVQAASRMLYHYPDGYPTRARNDVDAREVVEVGSNRGRQQPHSSRGGPSRDELVDRAG